MRVFRMATVNFAAAQVLALAYESPASASAWANYKDAASRVAASESEREPLSWSVVGKVVENHSATCQMLADDEFDAHECAATLAALRSKAEAVLAAGVRVESTVQVDLGDFDFNAGAFPLLISPSTFLKTDPPLCVGAVGGDDSMCVFSGQPKKLSRDVTAWLYGGYPTTLRRTQLAGPWVPTSTVMPVEVAKTVRDAIDGTVVLFGTVTFTFTFDPAKCVASSGTSSAYCWGGSSPRLVVDWPQDVVHVLAGLPPPETHSPGAPAAPTEPTPASSPSETDRTDGADDVVIRPFPEH